MTSSEHLSLRVKTLLVVINCPSSNTEKLANSVIRGANHTDVGKVHVVFKIPLDATAEDVLNCDGIILGTTENFGYMSGVLKDFFERIYYPCIERTQGLPYGLYVRAGQDGVGAQRAVEQIVTGLRWSAIQPCVTLKGDYDVAFEQQCHELGMLMAAGLDAGVF